MKVKKLNYVAIIIIAAVVVAVGFIYGFATLKSGENCKAVKIDGAKCIGEIKNTYYGITTGTEYYYLGISNSREAYLIKASKNWLDGKFDSDYAAIDENGVSVSAPVKDLSFHGSDGDDLENKFFDKLSEYESTYNLTFPYGKDEYISADYKKAAVLSIEASVILLVLEIIAAIVLILKKRANYGEVVGYDTDLNPIRSSNEGSAVFDKIFSILLFAMILVILVAVVRINVII